MNQTLPSSITIHVCTYLLSSEYHTERLRRIWKWTRAWDKGTHVYYTSLKICRYYSIISRTHTHTRNIRNPLHISHKYIMITMKNLTLYWLWLVSLSTMSCVKCHIIIIILLLFYENIIYSILLLLILFILWLSHQTGRHINFPR